MFTSNSDSRNCSKIYFGAMSTSDCKKYNEMAMNGIILITVNKRNNFKIEYVIIYVP